MYVIQNLLRSFFSSTIKDRLSVDWRSILYIFVSKTDFIQKSLGIYLNNRAHNFIFGLQRPKRKI